MIIDQYHPMLIGPFTGNQLPVKEGVYFVRLLDRYRSTGFAYFKSGKWGLVKPCHTNPQATDLEFSQEIRTVYPVVQWWGLPKWWIEANANDKTQ